MNRRQICEFLVKNEIGEGDLMAYADHGDLGCAAVGHNGMKFTYTAEELAQTEAKLKPKRKRAPRPKASETTAKPSAKRATTKKAADKK